MTDAQLARLFDQRDRAEKHLRQIDARILGEREAYSKRHGLLMFPSVDSMRSAVRAREEKAA